MKLLILALFLSGCGADTMIEFAAPVNFDDAKIEKIYSEFIKDALKYGADPYVDGFESIHYGFNEEKSVIVTAQCYSYEDGTAEIALNERMRDVSYEELRAVLYHELGHCLLGLEHTHGSALMRAWYSKKLITQNWDSLVREMMSSAH